MTATAASLLVRGASGARRSRVLLASVVVVATCGMVYELVAGTLAGYLLGSAVTEFAIVLGVYLSAMGVGALASTALPAPLAARFVEIEAAVALAGGSSAAVLLLAFAHVRAFRPVLYLDVFVIGALVGVELPLLLRLLRDELGFTDAVTRGFTFDYVGSLLASLFFPLVLVPVFGLVRGAALAGVVNAIVALLGATLIQDARVRRSRAAFSALTGTLLLAVAGWSGAIVRATAE